MSKWKASTRTCNYRQRCLYRILTVLATALVELALTMDCSTARANNFPLCRCVRRCGEQTLRQ